MGCIEGMDEGSTVGRIDGIVVGVWLGRLEGVSVGSTGRRGIKNQRRRQYPQMGTI